MSKVVLFSLILHLNAKVKRAIVKMQSVCEYFVHEETSEWVWVFYWREKNCKSEYFCSFLRASKIQRGFSARATQNFGDKKESKTATFGIKKRRGKKKPLVEATISYGKIILSWISNIMGFFYFWTTFWTLNDKSTVLSQQNLLTCFNFRS